MTRKAVSGTDYDALLARVNKQMEAIEAVLDDPSISASTRALMTPKFTHLATEARQIRIAKERAEAAAQVPDEGPKMDARLTPLKVVGD